ncbi:hypothetical protein MNBD_GAMMA05-1983 [hydrothermal vent metagenome]|uniref:Uncharacterized protein n=1 Tax=hydrothermal vent metagenome TaxID=652676 RepID=A0A3B0X584_9ZZZZ
MTCAISPTNAALAPPVQTPLQTLTGLKSNPFISEKNTLCDSFWLPYPTFVSAFPLNTGGRAHCSTETR